MKTTFLSLALLAALTTTAGCADVAGVLAPTPGASAGTTVTPAGTATTAPGATATAAPTTPTATAMPTAAPAAPKMGDPAITAAQCAADKENFDKDNGTEDLGAYNNQYLPKGWLAAYSTEAEVTAAISRTNGADWACFQKFYPGAVTVWKRSQK